MKRYKLYLFDFDGTLADSFEALKMIFKTAFAAVGIEVGDDKINWLSRVPLDYAYEKLGGTPDKLPVFGKTIYDCLFSQESINLTRFFPDAIEFIQYAQKNNIQIGVVTSNQTSHVYEILEHLNIDKDAFAIVLGSDECDEFKPSPKPINIALKKLNYQGSLEDVVYVGDSSNDYKCAVNAHVTPILIDREERNEEGFVKIEKLTELI